MEQEKSKSYRMDPKTFRRLVENLAKAGEVSLYAKDQHIIGHELVCLSSEDQDSDDFHRRIERLAEEVIPASVKAKRDRANSFGSSDEEEYTPFHDDIDKDARRRSQRTYEQVKRRDNESAADEEGTTPFGTAPRRQTRRRIAVSGHGDNGPVAEDSNSAEDRALPSSKRRRGKPSLEIYDVDENPALSFLREPKRPRKRFVSLC